MVFNCIPLILINAPSSSDLNVYSHNLNTSIEVGQNEPRLLDKIDIPGELSLYRNVFAGIYFIACEGDEGVCFSIDLGELSGDGGFALEIPSADRSMHCERMNIKRDAKGVQAQFAFCK